jgi:hypothetical protein
MAPNPKKSYLGIYEHPLVEKTLKITKPWYDALSQLVASASASLVAGPDKSVQYNKSGVQAGSAEFTFDDGIQQVAITADTASSQLVVQNATASTGVESFNPRTATYQDMVLGAKLNTSGDYIPNSTSEAIVFHGNTENAGIELDYGLTPGSPVPFTTGVVVQLTGPNEIFDPAAIAAVQFGGLGTGAKPGMSLVAYRNDDGSGAASTLGLEELSGTRQYIWFDATGAPRYGPARPTENGSVSDTSGTLFGSGGGTVTNTYTQLFTRRGEDGRIGTPGLPGPQGATGSTGATGPAGAAGIIITRRSDEGRNGMPGLQGANGADGATGAAGAPGAVTGRRADVGPRGVPGGIGPTGSSAPATRAITFAIDGGGSTLTTGVKADVYVPYAATITANTLLGDQSGSIVLDIKKSTYAGFPGSLTSIVASAAPTITTAQKSTDSTLTGWTTGISAGDVLEFSISSVTSLTRLNCTLTVTA